MLSSSFLRERNWWKFVTFSSQSLGSLWPTVALGHMESLFHCMNLLHQLGLPTNSVTFICFANSFAFKLIIIMLTARLFSHWLTTQSFNVLSRAGNVITSALAFWYDKCTGILTIWSWHPFSVSNNRSLIHLYFISTEIYPQRWQWWKNSSVFSHSQSETGMMKWHWWKIIVRGIWLDKQCFSLVKDDRTESHVILGVKTGKPPFYFKDCGRRFSWQFYCRTKKQSNITKNTTICKTFAILFRKQKWT